MSLNDHGWGNQPGGGKRGGGNQGPPDLEELWRDFNRRLSGLFGNKGGGGGGEGGVTHGRPESILRPESQCFEGSSSVPAEAGPALCSVFADSASQLSA